MIRLALALFALATPATAQSPSYLELTRRQKLVSAPTLVQAYGSSALQGGELRLPPGKGPFPVAVVVHGGCWLSSMADRGNTAPLADALTKRGIATWNIGYRRLGDQAGGWPGTFEDIAAATDHLRVLGKTQPLDLSRTTIVGHSAGAHLALWAASRHKLQHPIAGKEPLKFNSVFAIDGPGALAPFIGIDEQVCGQPVISKLMGGDPASRVAEYRAASPADHLPLGIPTYLVTGELAPFMLPYADAAKKAGEKVSVLSPEGADHFNLITPGLKVGDAVIDFIAANAFEANSNRK